MVTELHDPFARSVQGLRSAVQGRILLASDADYGAARRGRGLAPVLDRHPVLVAEPECAQDIALMLDFAQERGLEVSVRSGGNDVLGASTTAEGVLIDLHRLAAIDIDPATATARVGAGVRAGELTHAAAAHGLVPLVGMNPKVGVGGLTLGGGMGWFAGRFGATVDHLLAAEVVTANGETVRADAQTHPDLFWALRGGGGNFGVVTSFTYRLQEVGPVLAGDLVFAGDPGRLLRGLREVLATSPDELEIGALFTLAPDPAMVVRLCWSGDIAAGDAALRSLRALGPTVADTVRVQEYAQFAGAVPAFDTMVCRGGQLEGLQDATIDALTGIIDAGGPAGCMVGVLHYIHGALCRQGDDTPFLRAPGEILYNIVAPWQGDVPDPDRIAWADAASESLREFNGERIYVNYLSYPDEDYVRRAYGHHFDRLRSVKRRYDPANVFHNNRNIPV